MLSPAMAASSPQLAGAILIAAGAYQLTPWKGACLTHCRSPLGFLMTNWRDGQRGALRMGFRHGMYLPRLLLGADVRAVRGRRDEPRVGRGADVVVLLEKVGRGPVGGVVTLQVFLRSRRGCGLSDKASFAGPAAGRSSMTCGKARFGFTSAAKIDADFQCPQAPHQTFTSSKPISGLRR